MVDRRCVYCGDPVDPTGQSVWRRVAGWERKATTASRRSGSDITLREHLDEFACNGCVTLRRSGIPVGQETLL